jgi:hypothetical protein
MADRTRAYLRQEFGDGERPTGNDFKDLIDSFLNKEDDNVRLDANNNLSIPGGLNVGNAATGQPGTLRVNGGQLQLFDGGAWNAVGGGGGGAFQPVGAAGDVAYGGGNVGIGNFAVAPTHRLEVNLAANTGTTERVRFGQLVVHNGNNTGAHISHQNVAGNNQSFALRQDDQGNTVVNCAQNAQLAFQQNGTARFRFSAAGDVIMTPATAAQIDGNLNVGTLVQNRNLTVFGAASKPGGGTWAATSDARVKTDVCEFSDGLNQLCQLRPVKYKYNGKGGTPTSGQEFIGLVAQEVQDVCPYMVDEIEDVDTGKQDLLTFDSSALTYLLINAVQELSSRIIELEAQERK